MTRTTLLAALLLVTLTPAYAASINPCPPPVEESGAALPLLFMLFFSVVVLCFLYMWRVDWVAARRREAIEAVYEHNVSKLNSGEYKADPDWCIEFERVLPSFDAMIWRFWIWDLEPFADPAKWKRLTPFLSVFAALLLVPALAWGAVGFTPAPGALACTEGGVNPGTWTINLAARPWGPTGNGLQHPPTYHDRYHGGNQDVSGWPCGAAAELLQSRNVTALRNACAGLCSAIPVSGGDCIPTQEEIYDLAHTTPRCSTVYRRCAHDLRASYTPENPAELRGWDKRFETAGVCEPGVYAVPGPYCNWPDYYRVGPEDLPAERPWCDDEEPPPPPPPPPPTCEPVEESRWAALCDERFGGDRELCEARAERYPNSDLGRAWPKVCKEPEPPGETCREWTVRFVPATESTGRSVLVVVNEEGAEVPCE